MALLAVLGNRLGQALLPNACVFCGGRRKHGESRICEPCHADLPWIDKACARCAGLQVAQLPHGVHCVACQQDPPPFEAAVAPLAYAFPVDAAIKALKFRRKLFYAPLFAGILAESMLSLPAGIDALLPVPLHWRRQALRGFNQATEIARPIGRISGIPLIGNVIRVRATPYQSGLAAQRRQGKLRGAFSIRGALDARHVLIIDDVITTGETCRQISRTLLDAGVGRVSILAVARA
jgi:ComF family protein